MNRRNFVAAGAGVGAGVALAKRSDAQSTGFDNSIYLQPSGGDDTTQIYNALAAIAPRRGARLVFLPGAYNVPNGITENKQGLVVVGYGVTSQGPGLQGNAVGVQLKATAPGAWVWRKEVTGASNDYYGGRFENIGFLGDTDTAGGLRIEASYCVVMNCESHGNTTGIGFLITPPALGNSAQVNKLLNCGSSDDLTGFQINGGCNTLVQGCYNLKYSSGGISGTGVGIRVIDSNTQIIGGKFERNDIGVLLLSNTTSVIGTGFEGNTSWDVDCARASGTTVSGNIIISPPCGKIRFGAFQVADTFIGGMSPHTVVDNGINTILIGDRRVRGSHVGATVPAGGLSGEIKVGNGRLWVQDRGVWKSVAVY